MPDGGGVVLAVDVLVGRHVDTLDTVPGRRAEDQGRRDTDVIVIGRQREGDGDRTSGGSVQPHRVEL